MGVQAGGRQNVRQHKKGRPEFPGFLIAVILIIVVYLLGLEAWQWFSSRLVEIQPLQKGVLVQEVSGEAVLIKGETPVKAPAGGKVKMLVNDGDRVRLGSAIARITGIERTVTVYSPRAGIICRHIDGLEGTLRSESINVLDIKAIEKIGASDSGSPEVGKVEKGMPFCKLVDNLEPLFMYLRLGGDTSINDFGKRKKMDIIWREERFSGSVLELRDGTEKEILLQVNDYPEELLHMRNIEVRVIVKELQGYPVSYDALVFRGNKAGILVIEQKSIKWTPVEIAGRMNGKVVLNEKGLGANTQYVVNPLRVKEGSGMGW